ncbi:alpha-N-acetylglucosaminidase [Flavobacterium reichenbachii]|uniref:Alpha-N-acetylglucosaminidase n=1 Tax=Flavobacterium reichenbachii TaxID=362418 RepID=A0A085ZDW8_9FLAO|nr:alpha-N-acetylglucosaminidase [Flavobacterium reichenbachii]KFF02632.1 alpha-N-acetylglucosaminidase [Flavobacterium reichenbachii]OXB11128.1 alpha-N-acetylglucosaminidase [Flavobacterium reichenbachii]
MKGKNFKITSRNFINKGAPFFIMLFFITSVGYCKSDEKTKSSLAVIERLIGSRANEFDLEVIKDPSKSNWFEVETTNNRVKITASDHTAICYAAYNFLRDIGAVLVSWEGNRINLPQKWPSYSKKGTTPFKYREYLNACTFGYTTPWWDWKRWEQEIDWMAVHGINLPTAMEGQEAVWQRLWKEYGLTDSQLQTHFAGPAFLPWQRMGNINSLEGPLPQEFISKKEDLQKKILERMRTLEMHPVVPAFSGYVPKAFAEKHPEAKISELKSWSGGGFESTFLLDSKDPLFKEIGKRFIEIYTKVYGKSDFYLADSFNEITPPVSEQNKYEELSNYGSAIFETINEASPGAVWVMQGWLFGDNKEFWTKEATSAFLSKVPNDRLMIQDYANDRYKVWENQEAFYGKQWTYGYVHNYGGSNPVYGDLNFYKNEITTLLQHPNKGNVVGYGAMPEGLNNNSVVYEYIYDLAWSQGEQPINDWLTKYLHARYGQNTGASAFKAWELLLESVYSTKYWETRWWKDRAGAYLFFKRPTASITEFKGNPGDKKKLKEALDLLNEEAKKYDKKNFIHYDLADASRHYYSLCIDEDLVECVKAYQQKDIAKGDKLFKKIEKQALDIDKIILSAQPLNSLDYWVKSASEYGSSPADSQLYVKNAKTLITLWGGEGHLNDYASRSWSGMYKGFYWPRWKMFLEALKKAAINKTEFNETKERELIKNWEINWTENK